MGIYLLMNVMNGKKLRISKGNEQENTTYPITSSLETIYRHWRIDNSDSNCFNIYCWLWWISHSPIHSYNIGIELHIHYRHDILIFLYHQNGICHQRNYVELYRVIDYREDQSFIQMVFGIKTITIYSGDRSNPQLKLIGIKNDMDLISIIRQRVEYNKKRRNIYEFTNNQLK